MQKHLLDVARMVEILDRKAIAELTKSIKFHDKMLKLLKKTKKCKKHPQYRAIRKPRVKCPECLEMWAQRNS